MDKSKCKSPIALCLLILSLFACSVPTSIADEDDQSQGDNHWQADVDEIKQITQGLKIPGHLIDPESEPTEALFDPNQLLRPLEHLSLQPGYTLDFVYKFDGSGGRPYLYARKTSDTPFENVDAFQTSLEACKKENPQGGCHYYEFIDIDGTPEGYFQWILLRMMGDQFYLYWHAGYNDKEIIASQARLEELVNRLKNGESGVPISETKSRQALKLDPLPKITIQEENVTLRILWFTKWGGFTESIYTITTAAPHRIIDQQDTLLLEYDCGILF